MKARLLRLYHQCTLERPWIAIALVVLVLGAAATQFRHFQLDASAESLVLEGDEAMHYYREIRARYGSDDFLIVTWTPSEELFADATLSRLKALRDDLLALPAVDSVLSILDVPLLDSPRVSFSEVQAGTRSLLDEDTDRDLAREEFRNSPLYANLLMNQAADTTALILFLERDEEAHALLSRREELRIRRARDALDEAEARELQQISERYRVVNAQLQEALAIVIADVRAVLDRHRDSVRIHLGGVPMIAVDMIEFVRGDIRSFGIGVALFIIILLAISFQRLRWVVVPSLICGGVVAGMVGFLGFMGWPVTVVSSNFISLVLILTLSLIVHLVVRQRELHVSAPDNSARELMRETLASKFKPSLFTALTTMVAFASMMFADIRPVMDFGLMMVCAVAFALMLTFVLFPALVVPWPVGPVPRARRDVTAWVSGGLSRLVRTHGSAVWLVFAVVTVVSILGVSRLTVENRFIDYFKPTTEIYQGMVLIDQELGGTTPLDVVLDATREFLEFEVADTAFNGEAGLPDDDFDYLDDLDYGYDDELSGPVGGYWFTSYQLETVDQIQSYLDSLPETGKILSLAVSMRVITMLNNDEPLDGFALAVMYDRLPGELRELLFDPYMSEDGHQIRFDIRVIDSDPNLARDALLAQIREDLIERFDLLPEQVNLTGMLVLYNNVMQSLVTSMYLTMFLVFAAMMVMFAALFRSWKMALVGPAPTLVAAVAVLGAMGLAGLPLDIMTMTIAAITIGIGVHDTIHYTHRFEQEIGAGRDYLEATEVTHLQVGRAMIYTSVIIIGGFSILMLSNFMPTIYFGVLTGVAMLFALLSNLTLLPLLLQRMKPFAA
ncbi:MAG: MMPL family transporter [Gammaproteobacteria bacterium]|nr:MMPL family transporter [Gammaproteobacteria bacterium]